MHPFKTSLLALNLKTCILAVLLLVTCITFSCAAATLTVAKLKEARAAGLTDKDILEYLSQYKGSDFDYVGAVQAGYSLDEIAAYLDSESKKMAQSSSSGQAKKELPPSPIPKQYSTSWEKSCAERDAKRNLEEALQSRFSSDSFRNASIASEIAKALIRYANVAGGTPQQYIPSEYKYTDYERLILNALNNPNKQTEVIRTAVMQNSGAKGNDYALSMANRMDAIKYHDIHTYTATDLLINPGIPVPAVHGEIDSVTITGQEYEVHTTDGRIQTGWFTQNVDKDGFGSTITRPSSGGSIMTTVTPNGQNINW